MAAGIGLAAVALAALDGGIARWAQHAGNAYLAGEGGTPDWGGYPFAGHVLSMLLLAAFTVAVTATVAIDGNRILAFVVLALVAVGPMTVVAAPVTVSLITTDSEIAQLWWRLLIASAQFTILASVLWWCVRCLQADQREIGAGRSMTPTLSEPILFSTVAGLVILAEMLVQPLVVGQSPRPLPLLGWAFLTAATTLMIARSDRMRTAFITFGGAALTLGVMSLAYLRGGGWPGVAGWEISSIQSPVVLSVPTAVLLLGAPLIGRAVRFASVHRAAERQATPALAP